VPDPAETGGVDPSRIVDRSEPAGAFGALGDPARLAILGALASGTRCVCELGPELGLAQNLLSYHLKILRRAGLVSGRRSGRRIEYGIRADRVRELRDALDRLGRDAR
jgi:DNA-binding transcriptional ArsR family regulator